MAFEERTDDMTCRNCGALHKATWSRMPVREFMTVKCCACHQVMYSGNTTKDYYRVIRVNRD